MPTPPPGQQSPTPPLYSNLQGGLDVVLAEHVRGEGRRRSGREREREHGIVRGERRVIQTDLRCRWRR
eukprot:2212365-Alexandrium_andersonii.AAC.1